MGNESKRSIGLEGGQVVKVKSDFIHQSLSLDNDNFWYIITHYCIYITGITKLNEIRFD